MLLWITSRVGLSVTKFNFLTEGKLNKNNLKRMTIKNISVLFFPVSEQTFVHATTDLFDHRKAALFVVLFQVFSHIFSHLKTAGMTIFVLGF